MHLPVGAGSVLVRAPRTVLPSSAHTRRRSRAGMPASTARAASCAPAHMLSASSTAAGSSCWSSLRMVDSCGTRAPIPSRSNTTCPVSWAYSAIATNERAPASTAHALTSSTASTPWRTPRAARGSGIAARASSSDNAVRSTLVFVSVSVITSSRPVSGVIKAARIGEDDNAGTAS